MFDNEKGYCISDIAILNFKNCSVMFNTYHGTIISMDDISLCEEIEEGFNIPHYDRISDHPMTKKPKPEKLFDGAGNLNSKIKDYAHKTGLDIRSLSSSLKVRVSNVGNDYSYLEKYYKDISGHDLLSTNPNYKKKYKIANISMLHIHYLIFKVKIFRKKRKRKFK